MACSTGPTGRVPDFWTRADPTMIRTRMRSKLTDAIALIAESWHPMYAKDIDDWAGRVTLVWGCVAPWCWYGCHPSIVVLQQIQRRRQMRKRCKTASIQQTSIGSADQMHQRCLICPTILSYLRRLARVRSSGASHVGLSKMTNYSLWNIASTNTGVLHLTSAGLVSCI
jgi:hypothetical protein